MEVKTEIVNGKRRIIMIKRASGVDKTKEAVLRVMGDGYEFVEPATKKEVC